MSRVTRHEMIAIRALQLSETTHRFCYRPVARADAHPMFEAGLDSDFHRYLDWPKPADVDGHVALVDAHDNRMALLVRQHGMKPVAHFDSTDVFCLERAVQYANGS